MTTKILSVGGSIVVPNKPDTEFLAQFISMTKEWLSKDNNHRLILVIGGGAPARIYQQAYQEILKLTNKQTEQNNTNADWIGIMATRLNAQLLKALYGNLCEQDVIYNPTEKKEFTGRVLIASGWKPGFSTDNDAVLLAEQYKADTVINLSNIEKVYTDDPKTNPEAKAIDDILWSDFRKIVGDEWLPGKNTPFDPIASKKAQELKLSVICAGGKNIENIKNILEDKTFIGTKIH